MRLKSKQLMLKEAAEHVWGIDKKTANDNAHSFPNGWLLNFLRAGRDLNVCEHVNFCLKNCEYAKGCKQHGEELLNKEDLTDKDKKWGNFQVKCGTTILKKCEEEEEEKKEK